MSVTKDKKTGKWMSQTRVKNWTGKEIHKKKRGFITKKEALQWERDFINQSSGSLGMSFMDFIELYIQDMEKRLKPSTVANKRFLIDLKIIPYFENFPLDAIKPTDIRKWQNELTGYRNEKGKPYSQTYLKTINNQITAIFNYAVKYYGLKENPCHKAGSMGKKNADEMEFWTKDEFATFIEVMKERPASYAIFMTNMEKCYELQPEDRLFPCTKSYLQREIERGCKLSCVKEIRMHNIRHSHASLLVEMGFSPLLIAGQLGHERIQTTTETYSYLYPNKQVEVANKLDKLSI